MRIAFLGLGHMGLPMARNLLGAKHTVAVYNRTPGRAAALVSLGGREAKSVADAVKDAEVAITMLLDDAAVKELVHGPGGLLEHLPPKALHLCMGTISVETSATLASAHAQAGQGYVAAPVFGRPDTAATRHIWIVAAGSESQVNRCRPIFEALGQGYTRVGHHAAVAHALKLGGNTCSLAMELAVSEVLTYAARVGMPPAEYLRLLNMAIFRSHMVDDYGGVKSRPSFDPADLSLDLVANELLLQKARDMGVPIPVADQLNARLLAAGARGWGEQDLAELTQASRLETEQEEAPAPAPRERPPSPQAEVPAQLPPPPRTPPPFLPPPPAQTEPKKVPNKKASRPQEAVAPQPLPPTVMLTASALKELLKSAHPPKAAKSHRILPSNAIPAMDGETPVTLDLKHTSHFELIEGRVWAWSEGKPYETRWNSLSQVELTFNQVLFLLVGRQVLLRPEAVLGYRATFGGGARVRVSEELELEVSRAAAPRLKELLGI